MLLWAQPAVIPEFRNKSNSQTSIAIASLLLPFTHTWLWFLYILLLCGIVFWGTCSQSVQTPCDTWAHLFAGVISGDYNSLTCLSRFVHQAWLSHSACQDLYTFSGDTWVRSDSSAHLDSHVLVTGHTSSESDAHTSLPLQWKPGGCIL